MQLFFSNDVVEDLNATFATVVVFFLREEGQRQHQAKKGDLRESRPHHGEHFDLIRVRCVEALGVFADLNLNIGLVVVRVDD